MARGLLTQAEWVAEAAKRGGVNLEPVKNTSTTSTAGGSPLLSAGAAAVGRARTATTTTISGPQKFIAHFADGTQMTVYFDNGTNTVVVADPDTWGKDEDAGGVPVDNRQPDQKQLDLVQLEQAKANLAKSQQAAAPQPGAYESAAKDYQDSIDYIQAEIAAGRMTFADGNKMIAQVKQNFSDKMAGSSQYDRAKAAADYRQNNAQLGGSLLNQRVSSGTSMANQLYQGANDLFAGGKIASGSVVGDPYSFNPFRLAKNFVTDLGGGQQTYDAASQMVQGALGGGQDDPVNPAYWFGTPQNPGDSGAPDEQIDNGTLLPQLNDPNYQTSPYGAGLDPSRMSGRPSGIS